MNGLDGTYRKLLRHDKFKKEKKSTRTRDCLKKYVKKSEKRAGDENRESDLIGCIDRRLQSGIPQAVFD